jgi:hypothetical protein
MGWCAKLVSGEVVKESGNVNWNDVNIHFIESLWIEGFEKFRISKKNIDNFLEFVQFKTANVDLAGKIYIESRCFGWSDGENEYLFRVNEETHKVTTEIIKRIHFHPMSFIELNKSVQKQSSKLI